MNQPYKSQAYVAAKHKRARKLAHRRNRGRFDTMTGEDKNCHEKRALKRHFDALAISTPFDAVLLKSTAQPLVMPRILPAWRPNLWKPESMEDIAA